MLEISRRYIQYREKEKDHGDIKTSIMIQSMSSRRSR